MTFPASAKTTTFIITRDRPRAVAFYRDVLGFRQTGEHDFAAVFDLNGVVMQLVTVADHKPSPHTVLGWEVEDIAADVKALKAKGIKFEIYEGFGQDELGIWHSPDGRAKLAWFLDPDGNNLSLAQH
jgi:catechol 2,3-dioxygenase-like lactoylglutathione lyase family enzyme